MDHSYIMKPGTAELIGSEQELPQTETQKIEKVKQNLDSHDIFISKYEGEKGMKSSLKHM
jgi:hypothetical protein